MHPVQRIDPFLFSLLAAEIVACYGSDMTEHALNHRFRRVRAQASIISEARARRLDIKELSTDENILPATQGGIDKNSTAFSSPALHIPRSYLISCMTSLTDLFLDIAKYFGQSTADGIQFQFRTIKKDAEALRQTANDGGDVANCLSLGVGSSSLAPGTPSKPTPSRSQPGSRSGKGAKRKVAVAPVSSPIKRSLSDDEGEDDELNFDEMDVTPSKRVKTTGRAGPARGTTPSRSAAVKAAATIAEAANQQPLSSGSSPEEMPAPIVAPVLAPHRPPPNTISPQSIFGDVERKPQQQHQPRSFMTSHGSAMSFMGAPAPWPELNTSFNSSSTSFMDSHYINYDDGEGEI